MEQAADEWDAIPRLGKVTEELVERLERTSQPAILDTSHLPWSAMSWTLDSLKNQYGHVLCSAFLNMPRNQPLVNFFGKDYTAEIKLADFIRKIESGNEACYIRQMSVRRAPELESEFDFNDITSKSNYKQSTNFWLASANTKSTLHWDTPNNLLSQIIGKKNVILYSPQQSRFLYPFTDQLRLSQLDPLKWNTEEHPEFSYAQPLKGTLCPGETLFLPKCWWHFMYQSEPSVSLSNWYGDEVASAYFYTLAKSQSWKHLMKPTVDFFRLGLCGAGFNQRLSSDVPTGVYFYNLFKNALTRRR